MLKQEASDIEKWKIFNVTREKKTVKSYLCDIFATEKKISNLMNYSFSILAKIFFDHLVLLLIEVDRWLRVYIFFRFVMQHKL